MDIESTIKYLKDNKLMLMAEDNVVNKIHDFMNLLGLSESEVCKLVLKSNKLLTLDTKGVGETLVIAKLNYLEKRRVLWIKL